MVITMNKYFDESIFNQNPIKTELKTYYFNFKVDQAYVKDLYYAKNTLNTFDHFLSSFLARKSYTYFTQQ